MTSEKMARLLKLRKKQYRDSGLTDDEEREYDKLGQERHREIMAMVPVLTCCDAARTHPAIGFFVDYDEGDSHEALGVWRSATHESLMREQRMLDEQHYKKPVPEPKVCSYCGTPVPKMKRKNPIPKTLCHITDGGYYCSRCRERLDGCLCDPLSSGFEPA